LTPVAVLTWVLAIWERASRVSSAAESALGGAEFKFGEMLAREANSRHSLMLDPAGREHPVNLHFDKVTSPLRNHGGPPTGDLVSVADYFQSLSPRRLVVLGAPGSGKTVLAMELQVRLLELRAQVQIDPLPVLVTAASYESGKTWVSWLAGHLAQRYVLPEGAVERPITDGRILPLIDGVDELERSAASALSN
jgi:predicted NACHT family NTPase